MAIYLEDSPHQTLMLHLDLDFSAFRAVKNKSFLFKPLIPQYCYSNSPKLRHQCGCRSQANCQPSHPKCFLRSFPQQPKLLLPQMHTPTDGHSQRVSFFQGVRQGGQLPTCWRKQSSLTSQTLHLTEEKPPNCNLAGSSVVKNLPANAGDANLIHGLRRSPGEVNGNPLQYSCLGNPMAEELSYSPWGRKESNMNWRLNNITNFEKSKGTSPKVRQK